jgi:hypothetical protein
MYRQYENPSELEEQIRLKRNEALRIEEIMNENSEMYAYNQELLFSIQNEISELEQRLNFAWQDEEFG